MKTKTLLFLFCFVSLNVMGQGTITRNSTWKPKPQTQKIKHFAKKLSSNSQKQAKVDNHTEDVATVGREIIEVTVKERETAYSLARKRNMKKAELEKLNPGVDVEKLHPGDKIKVYKE